jgi:hypothetical protein
VSPSRRSHRPFDRRLKRAPSDLYADNTMRKATSSEKRQHDSSGSARCTSRDRPARGVRFRHANPFMCAQPFARRQVCAWYFRMAAAARTLPGRIVARQISSSSFGGTLGRLPRRWKIGEIEKPSRPGSSSFPLAARARHLEPCRTMRLRSKPSLDVRGSHDSLRGRTRAVARPRDGSRRVIRAKWIL